MKKTWRKRFLYKNQKKMHVIYTRTVNVNTECDIIHLLRNSGVVNIVLYNEHENVINM